MKRMTKIVFVILTVLVLTLSAFGTGFTVGTTSSVLQPAVAKAASFPSEFNTFWEAWQIVHRYFIDRQALDSTQLTYGAIRGMITALGDEGHTVFLTPEEVERHETDVSGTYTGIGATIGMEEGLPVIVAPFEGSPAETAGVKSGDILIEVDDVDITSWNLNDIVEEIRGESGTQVELTVLRPDETKSYEISIVRGEIDAPTATWAKIPETGVALLRLSQFSADANDELTAAIREARAAGATSFIMDVRNNPGGLLEQALNVTSQFLDHGYVLQEEDAEGNRKAYPVHKGGLALDVPMVVLINRGSASSSEIFAGALQDYSRATLVGETTFGTGTVLQPFSLSDGSELMLGTSQWLTAEGRLIRKQGIEPDVVVELPAGSEMLYPSLVEDMTLEEILAHDDVQVLKALELLDALPEGQ